MFIAVKNAKFRGTAISQKAKFRGHFAVKMPNFAAISRRKFKISRLFRGQYCSEMTQYWSKFEYDYDEIYHLAAINGTANFYNIPDQVLRVNTLIVLNLLQWAVNNNIKSNNFI